MEDADVKSEISWTDCSFWKIQNVNRPYDNVRSRDPFKCPIRASLNDLTF